MKCAGCGRENREGAKFCRSCGAKLGAPESELMLQGEDVELGDADVAVEAIPDPELTEPDLPEEPMAVGEPLEPETRSAVAAAERVCERVRALIDEGKQ